MDEFEFLPKFDQSKILRQFDWLTKHFDLDVYLQFPTNVDYCGAYFWRRKLIHINPDQPSTTSKSTYNSFTHTLCHEIRHAIQYKKKWLTNNHDTGMRIYKRVPVYKVGGTYPFDEYVKWPHEIDAELFAEKWEKKLIRLGIV